MRRLLTDLVEAPIQEAATQRPREYLECELVELVYLAPQDTAAMKGPVQQNAKQELPPPGI